MSRQKIELQYYSTLSYPNKTTLLNCVSYISGSNRFPAYAEYLLVSKYPFRLQHERTRRCVGPAHPRTSFSIYGWLRETEWPTSQVQRWSCRPCPPSIRSTG